MIVYTLQNCPNCELLKDFLQAKGLEYEEKDMMSAEALTDLRVNGVFVQEAPVLRIDGRFLTNSELFLKGAFQEETIMDLASGG